MATELVSNRDLGDSASEDIDLGEEQASQGFTAAPLRWVLAIGLALTCLALAGAALFH